MVAAGDSQNWADSDVSSSFEHPIDVQEDLWGKPENKAHIFMQI